MDIVVDVMIGTPFGTVKRNVVSSWHPAESSLLQQQQPETGLSEHAST